MNCGSFINDILVKKIPVMERIYYLIAFSDRDQTVYLHSEVILWNESI